MGGGKSRAGGQGRELLGLDSLAVGDRLWIPGHEAVAYSGDPVEEDSDSWEQITRRNPQPALPLAHHYSRTSEST